MHSTASVSSTAVDNSNAGVTAKQARVRAYRRDIDGLRSLAILSVVLFHAGVPGVSGGFIGVDIFFVISGFLIGGHIHGDLKSGTFSFLNFYRLRAKRILPALYVVLIAVLIAGLLLLSPDEYLALAKSAFASTASASNFLFWRTKNYFAPASDQYPLLMTWSLAVEEQFYFVIPILLVILERLRRVLMLPLIGLVILVSFALAWFEVVHNPTVAFYLPQCRAWELAAGVALAIWQLERPQSSGKEPTLTSSVFGWVGLVLILAPMVLLTRSTPFPGPAAVPPVLGTALLLAFPQSWVNRRLLQVDVLVFIGRVSYSFYLWHWPILAYLRVLRGGDFPMAWGLIALCFAFGIATLSYYWVEQPFRSSKIAAGPLLLRYGLVSVVLLAACSLVILTHGLPRRYPRAAAVDRAQLAVHEDPCLSKAGDSTPRLAASCLAPASSQNRFVLWGDSHAGALAQALRGVVTEDGYAFEEYAKTVCPPLVGVGRYYRNDPTHLRNCIAFNDLVLQRILADPRVKVVGLEAFWEGPFDPGSDDGKMFESGESGRNLPSEAKSRQILESSLRKTIQVLQAAGKQVVVFGDVPVFPVDPLWRMRTSGMPLRRDLAQLLSPHHEPVDAGSDQAIDTTPAQVEARLLLKKTVESVPGATFWDLRAPLCDAQSRCVYRDNEVPWFIDESHFSAAGGRKALEGWTLPPPRDVVPKSG